MVTYDIFEPGTDVNASIDSLNTNIGPIYAESWVKDKQPDYGKPFDMNVAAFVQMWLSNGIKLFVAMEDKKVVGYLIGMVFRPLPYNATVFQVEDWYARGDKEVEQGLFDFAMNAIRFIGCDEILIADRADRKPLVRGNGWKESNTYLYHRFVKA